MSEPTSGQSPETQSLETRDQSLTDMRKAADAQIPEGQSFFAPNQATGVAAPDTPPPGPAPVVEAASTAETAPASDPAGAT
jgi:hypothetical protein